MSLQKFFIRILNDIACALAPPRCLICGDIMGCNSSPICADCYVRMPFTRMKGREGNGVERIFWAKIPIRRANAFLYYTDSAICRDIAFAIKYHGRPEVAHAFGRIIATDLKGGDFFSGIDGIVPIPLSPEREKERGYNQCRMLADGIAEVTGLPIIDDAIIRTKDNPSQTHLTKSEREDNVRDIFCLLRPEAVAGKHLLLVDDVITTGSTLLSAGRTLAEGESVSLSILTLFVAGRHSEGADIFDEQETNPHE